jgi:hypothetical protein
MERREIPVERLTLDTVQSRDTSWVGDEEDRRLAENVQDKGLMQDLLVRPLDSAGLSPDGGSGGQYGVVAGGRRLHAAMEAGMERVPCKVIDTDDIDAAWTSLNENTERRDLSEGEVAQQLRLIHEMVRPTGGPTECPACGSAVEGEEDLLGHTEGSDCTLPGTLQDGPKDDRFCTEEQALRYLAYQFLGREDDSALELVQGHLRTAQLPPSVRALFKDAEERTAKEQKALENFGVDQETTLGSGEGKSGTSREVVALHETVKQGTDDAIDPTDAVLETVGSLNHDEMSEQELRRTLRSFRQDVSDDLDRIESNDDQRETFRKTLNDYREDIEEHYEEVEPNRPFRKVDVIGPEDQQHCRLHSRAMMERETDAHGKLVKELYLERLEELANEEGWM